MEEKLHKVRARLPRTTDVRKLRGLHNKRIFNQIIQTYVHTSGAMQCILYSGIFRKKKLYTAYLGMEGVCNSNIQIEPLDYS
jgi:hypothetical protein